MASSPSKLAIPEAMSKSAQTRTMSSYEGMFEGTIEVDVGKDTGRTLGSPQSGGARSEGEKKKGAEAPSHQ